MAKTSVLEKGPNPCVCCLTPRHSMWHAPQWLIVGEDIWLPTSWGNCKGGVPCLQGAMNVTVRHGGDMLMPVSQLSEEKCPRQYR